jgi:copper chaperone CopZ
MTYYIHNIPGRLRVKTPILKKNPIQIERVRQILQSIPGVYETEFNYVTGSVVIQYDTQRIESEQIVSVLKEEGYIDVVKVINNDEYIQRLVAGVGKAVSRSVSEAVLDMAIGNTPLSFVTVFI